METSCSILFCHIYDCDTSKIARQHNQTLHETSFQIHNGGIFLPYYPPSSFYSLALVYETCYWVGVFDCVACLDHSFFLLFILVWRHCRTSKESAPDQNPQSRAISRTCGRRRPVLDSPVGERLNSTATNGLLTIAITIHYQQV